MSITTVVTNWPWPKATNTNNLRAWPLRAAARHRRISGVQASCAAGPWSGRALPARTSEMQGPRPRQAAGGCDTRDRMRDIVFQVMGEQAARRLQKRSQHDQRNTPRNGGVFFAYCCRKAQKIDCNLCRVVVSFFYCPLKGCHRKALNRERGEPWKSGTACPRPSAW